MAPTELFRNAKTRSAREIPQQTVAVDLQRRQASAHTPVLSSYFHIPKPADIRRSQRIAKAAI